MALYNIYAGLGGSFGGATYQYTSDLDREEAENEAWEQACEIYESYEDRYGLYNYSDAIKEYCEENEIEEDSFTEEDYEVVDDIYNEYREEWMEYYVILTEEDTEISENELKII